jgi:hypothetical protein
MIEVNTMTFSIANDRLVKAMVGAMAYVSIPEGYELKRATVEKQNFADVGVFRFEKSSGINNGLGGEHYSFVVDLSNQKLLGFTWMDQRLSGGPLPSKEETRIIAQNFLEKIEHGLSNILVNLWIDRHDEKISVKGEKGVNTITISGMKYKCYREDRNDYAWVIIGSAGRIITFEQGIIWNNGRVTEKWLHDSWVKNLMRKNLG